MDEKKWQHFLQKNIYFDRNKKGLKNCQQRLNVKVFSVKKTVLGIILDGQFYKEDDTTFGTNLQVKLQRTVWYQFCPNVAIN